MSVQTSLYKQRGAIALFIAMILLFGLALVTLFVAQSGFIEQKVTSNDFRDKNAFEAAEAGVEFGLAYLQQNNLQIILDSKNTGFIDPYKSTDVTKVPLANKATFTISYSNPIAKNFNVIQIASEGVSDDGSITKTNMQFVGFMPYMNSISPVAPLISRKLASLGGNVTVVNLLTNETIWSGNSTSISGSATTVLKTGVSSNSKVTKKDVTQNDATLSSMNDQQFFQNFFTLPQNIIKGFANISYSNSINTNYSDSLKGVTNQFIWIDQTSGTALLNSTATIGSATEPVILVVNGPLQLGGNVTIYGLLYVTNDLTNKKFAGTATVNGSVIVGGSFNGDGTLQINYDNTLLGKVGNNLGRYAKIPGGWIDI